MGVHIPFPSKPETIEDQVTALLQILEHKYSRLRFFWKHTQIKQEKSVLARTPYISFFDFENFERKMPIASRELELWLTYMLLEETGAAARKTSLNRVVNTLQARFRFGKEKPGIEVVYLAD